MLNLWCHISKLRAFGSKWKFWAISEIYLYRTKNYSKYDYFKGAILDRYHIQSFAMNVWMDTLKGGMLHNKFSIKMSSGSKRHMKSAIFENSHCWQIQISWICKEKIFNECMQYISNNYLIQSILNIWDVLFQTS